MILTAPCKICNKRHLGCHAECKVYKAYKDELKRLREEIQRSKEFSGYRCEVFAKQEKYKRNHERSK